jgi:hypothetical protein
MSISSVGGVGSFDPTQMAKDFFKKADANGDGKIDKSELKTMLSKGPNGQSMTDALVDKIFAEVDTNGDGKIDQTENETQMKKMGAKNAPPPGGGMGGAQKSTAASQSGDSKVYDKRDLNKDGTVSAQEKIEYAMTHLSDTEATSGNQYDQQSTSTTGTQSLFDLSA